ncbi:hypothetical protein ACWDWO_25905 [Actinopolymorpha singaporensis]
MPRPPSWRQHARLTLRQGQAWGYRHANAPPQHASGGGHLPRISRRRHGHHPTQADHRPPGVELVEGDLSDLAAVPGLAGRLFDRILFLQSFGYAAGPVRALQTAREMLAEDGFILLTRTQPIRYTMERAEQNLWIEAAGRAADACRSRRALFPASGSR